jgi:hypothetical protein
LAIESAAVRIALIALACSGCLVSPIELDGLECPCAAPYVCDTTRNVCVETIGGRDAGLDAGRRDGGMSDGGMSDGGMRDGGMSDGGMRDGGMSDDAGRDAGPLDGGMLDETICDDGVRAYTFCDGFESGASFPEWDGVSDEGLGVTSLSTTIRYRGAGAFDTVTSEPSARAYLNYERLDHITSGRMHLRAYVYVRSTPPVDHVALMYLSGATGGVSFELYGDGDASIYLGGDIEVNATAQMPADRWVCVEISVNVADASTGSMGLYFDGVPVAFMSGIDTREGGYDAIAVGLSWTDSSNPASHVLFDEVIFDRSETPIGCD